MTTLNAGDFYRAVAEKTGASIVSTKETFGAALEVLKEELSKGNKIQFIGFGTFETRERAEREGRNPRQPEQLIKIPACKAPSFKAGKALKDAVNK